MGRLIDRVSLQLHNDFLFYKEVGQVIPNNDAFELNLYFWLKLHSYATREEFNLHRPLINFFEEPKAKDVMNLKRGPNQMLRYRLKRKVLFFSFYLCSICVHLWPVNFRARGCVSDINT